LFTSLELLALLDVSTLSPSPALFFSSFRLPRKKLEFVHMRARARRRAENSGITREGADRKSPPAFAVYRALIKGKASKLTAAAWHIFYATWRTRAGINEIRNSFRYRDATLVRGCQDYLRKLISRQADIKMDIKIEDKMN